MTKRIAALLLLVCMAVTLLAACNTNDAIDTEKAKQIALEDMGITEDQADVHVHIAEHEGVACFSVYITYNGAQTEYLIHGKTGEIVSKGAGSHSH